MERNKQLPLIYVGLAVACMLLQPSFASDMRAVYGLAVLSAGFLTAAAWTWYRARRDPYDLGLLREIHEREELSTIEPELVVDGGEIICPHCQTPYMSRLPVCPNCKRMP